MTEIQQGRTIRVGIDDVIPYWRNPRRVTGEAVEALRQSINAFGYQQPVVVDAKMIIIIGHTRYAAMRREGVTELDVMVVDYLPESKVKQLRVIDNRAAEYTSWDLDMLLEELDKADSELMKSLFNGMIDVGDDDPAPSYTVDTRDFTGEWDEVDDQVEFICPACFHQWETTVTREDILRGKINNGTA